MDKPLTTADIPRQFLKAAYYVGHIPQMALRSDPRVSYALYIPPDHYPASHRPRDDQDHRLDKLPLLVYIHSTRRDISSIRTYLVPTADSTPCAVLAPVFPAELDGPNDLDSYKLLHSRTLRSDLALLSILNEVAYRWPGIDTSQIYMMAFSGGAQYAHRFQYLYPSRIAAISIAAPGSVTHLDLQQTWPKGVADVEALFGLSIDRDRIGSVPIQLLV